MILLLDTSTPVCRLILVDGAHRYEHEWDAGRGLAKGILAYLQEQLESQGGSWQSITGMVAFQGPGSFTGLRIGLSVLNTIARANNVPIVGAAGEGWQQDGLRRLEAGENDEIVLPEYGGEAHITQPRK